MKIRMVVEYDPDWPDDIEPTRWKRLLEAEKEAWFLNQINVADIVDCGPEVGTVTWELIQ